MLLILNRYQKQSAKLIQEITASANEVRVETIFFKYFRDTSFPHFFVLSVFLIYSVGCTRGILFDENCTGLWNRATRTWEVRIHSQLCIFIFQSCI